MSAEGWEIPRRIDGFQGQDTVEILRITLESWVTQAVEQFKGSKGILKIGGLTDKLNDAPEVKMQLDGEIHHVLSNLRGEQFRQVVKKHDEATRAFAAYLMLDGCPGTGSSETLLILRFLEMIESRALEEGTKSLCQEDCVPLLEIHCQVVAEGLELHVMSPPHATAKAFVQDLNLRIQQSISNLPLASVPVETTPAASESELKAIWAWNATVPAVVQTCVHHIIAEQARLQPHAPAVSGWDGELDYEELDQISTRLAHHLVQLGAGPDDIIPLCFEKSKWMIVAILAVMKSGAVIAALDATQPVDRLQTIVKQLQPRWMIASSAQVEVATYLGISNVITLDESQIQQFPDFKDRDLPTVDPSSNLYVVFTSGSTGTPKGVMINHANFSSAIAYQHDALGINNTARVLDFASYAFDLAWGNIIHTLAAGGCLCIPSESERRGNITGAIRRLGVNHLQLTPSVARLIDPRDIPGLRLILLIGEPMTQADVAQWTPYSKLINSYGPAECTVAVTFQTILHGKAWDLSMGKGVACNTWIVDEIHGKRLVPLGHTGELWLEGPLVGQGYLGDSKKTAASFVDDPDWLMKGIPGVLGRRGRLYKTGDLVRYNRDGSLIYVARKDTQVKIRGQRVELGDVEYHLKLALPDRIVSVAAEAFTPRGSSSTILVAYLALGEVANGSMESTRECLASCLDGVEEYLTEQLPRYMVPSMYLAIPQIPMTTTGKIDRVRLREIGSSLTLDQLAELQPSRAAENKAPQTEMEYRLQKLWATTLNIRPDSIGLGDSFLRIGGESMAAIRLVQLARKEGILLTVADIFNQPRLSEMAQAAQEEQALAVPTVPHFSLLRRRWEGETDDARALAAAKCGVSAQSIEDLLPCTPLQEGLLALTAKRDEEYVHQIVSKLPDNVNLVRFRTALAEVIHEVAILRTRIVDLPNAGLMQVVITDQPKWTAGSDLGQFLELEKGKSMGLGTPLTRFGLVLDPADGHVHFVWTIHHALYDGWSLPLILERIEAIYTGGSSDKLPSFAGFVKFLADCTVEDAHTYWQSQLDGIQAAVFPALPFQGYQPQCQNLLQHHMANLFWPGNDITASTAVRTAWAILIARYTLSPDVVFGATVSGRQAPVPYIERMAGPTIATVPIRVNVQAEITVASLMQSIQAQAVAMIPYEQTGLKQIRRINLDTEQATQFQSLLVVQPPSQQSPLQPDQHLLKVDLGAGDEFRNINTYAVMLECRLGTHDMHLRMSYDRQAIETEQAERIVRQFEGVLRQVCSEGHAQELVRTVTTASQHDLAQIWAWNARVPQNIEGCVHDLVTERSQQQPDALAIDAWDGRLSYRELDVLSSQLAVSLLQRGRARTR
ncbi:acetyl-CoA synthetase-like protein [Penicillium macrosclerotiorum]|uniref:acetyl-CoA synthetase-like protein n=1 Tax=Penicillium macrosclerotiorum TaxID=303699 RepID=UPI002548C2DE|nr:acetyl-CoA synthetase-like protein [Penicillium macrosclerotiorum]KAJ5693237.1 acetyl-CoA synthetase-like protein [Penicillium macrosclerotiorum]